jgi:hypothetical protein
MGIKNGEKNRKGIGKKEGNKERRTRIVHNCIERQGLERRVGKGIGEKEGV